MDEFTHGRAEGRHFTCAARQQARIERFDVGVVTGGDDSRPVEHGAYPGRARLGQPGTAQNGRAGLAFHGHSPEIGGQLLGGLKGVAVHDRQQLGADLRSHGRNALA